MSLKGFFGHLRTINRHRHKVIAHCAKAGILWQGLRHDLSKYSPTEFIPGVKYFQGTRSPNEAERELNGYSLAWMHHKGRNRHHFEYWIDVDPVEKIYKPVKMPLRFLAEMFCDRVAACKTYYKENYNDSMPFEYFNKNRKHYMMHPETMELLGKMLIMLKRYGEEDTLVYIRERILTGRYPKKTAVKS